MTFTVVKEGDPPHNCHRELPAADDNNPGTILKCDECGLYYRRGTGQLFGPGWVWLGKRYKP